MKKLYLLWICFNYYSYSNQIVSLPIIVTGRIVERKEEVITEIEKGFYEIKVTNTKSKDIYVYDKTEKAPFIYKIASGITKIRKVKANRIIELYYIYENKKFKLNRYTDGSFPNLV